MCNNNNVLFNDRVFGFKSILNKNTKQERKQHEGKVTRTQVREVGLQFYNGSLHEKFKSIWRSPLLCY